MVEHTELAVEAQGYQRGSLVLRYKLTNAHKWDVPIVLKSLPVVPATTEEL